MDGRNTVIPVPVPTPMPDEDDTDLDLGPSTIVMSEEESKKALIKAVHRLVNDRRERVVSGVIKLMMDTYITSGIPPQFFPGTETFKGLLTQVRALMIAHDF